MGPGISAPARVDLQSRAAGFLQPLAAATGPMARQLGVNDHCWILLWLPVLAHLMYMYNRNCDRIIARNPLPPAPPDSARRPVRRIRSTVRNSSLVNIRP